MSNNLNSFFSLNAYIEHIIHCKSLVVAQEEDQFETHDIKAFEDLVKDQLYLDEGFVKKYPTLYCVHQYLDPYEVINIMKRDDPDLEGILVCMILKKTSSLDHGLMAWTWAQDIADAEQQLICWAEKYTKTLCKSQIVT